MSQTTVSMDSLTPAELAYAFLSNIDRQRGGIAVALAIGWPPDAPGTRCWHAVYTTPEGETRIALLYQVRGQSNFQVGCVREIGWAGDSGATGALGASDLKSPVLTTLEAVVWLGLHRITEPVRWVQAL